MKIEVHCADRSTPRCHKIVEVELEYSGLRFEDVRLNSTSKHGTKTITSVRITPPNPAWATRNQKSLSTSDLDQIKEHGYFEISYDDLDAGACDACGDGQSDDDGRH
jgi:hypothetical protein